MESVIAIVHSLNAVALAVLDLAQLHRPASWMLAGAAIGAAAIWLRVSRTATVPAMGEEHVETFLKLQTFADGHLPLSSGQGNIRRWCMLRNRIEVSNGQGENTLVGHQFILFIAFEAPVEDAKLVITSSKPGPLVHEVQELSRYTAIVLFNGGLTDGLLDVRVGRDSNTRPS